MELKKDNIAEAIKALKQCAIEHKNDNKDTFSIDVYSLCFDVAEFLEKEFINKEYKEQVNHPSHYNSGNIECIDAMLSAKGIIKTLAFCELSVFKYNWRQGLKDNECQEIKKQIWYGDKQNDLLNDNIINNPEALEIYNKIKELCNQLDTIIN